jgi:hypothetical protein
VKSEELKIARTEARFRNVNERIAETALEIGADQAELVCECADPECGERFHAPLDDYEEVRADGARFLIVAEHEEPPHERVIDSRPGFRIVEKLRGVAAAARRLNPRRAR